MNYSRPAVHPVEAPPLTYTLPRGTRLNDLQGMPGTLGGVVLRFLQFGFASIALCVMATTSDFPSVTAFRYLVAAVTLQCLWSLSLGITDLYALLVRRSVRNSKFVFLFSVGDGIISTLTFSSACASAGITVLVGNDLNKCAENHCVRFETAIAVAFLSWLAASPSFLLNFWTMASK